MELVPQGIVVFKKNWDGFTSLGCMCLNIDYFLVYELVGLELIELTHGQI